MCSTIQINIFIVSFHIDVELINTGRFYILFTILFCYLEFIKGKFYCYFFITFVNIQIHIYGIFY